MNLETTTPRGRPRNRWQDEVRENCWWRRVAGKSTQQREMEEAPENCKELSHSAHANGITTEIEWTR
jgi:hypothetical protein